jgi:hypothetical protein
LGFVSTNHVGDYLIVFSVVAGSAGFNGTVFIFNSTADDGTEVPLVVAPGASGFFALPKFAFAKTPSDPFMGIIDLTFFANVASSSTNFVIQFLG